MSPLRLPNPFRRDPETSPLKERGAALKAEIARVSRRSAPPTPEPRSVPTKPRQDAPALGSLADDIIACWKAYDAIPEENREDGDPLFEQWHDRRSDLIAAADALPATPDNLLPKALALAWIEHAELWAQGRERADYATDGRLTFDIHAAIVGSSPARHPDAALIALEAEFLATDAAYMAAVGAANDAWNVYAKPPTPEALRVWSNDWIHSSIPRPPIDDLPGGRGRQRPYGEREVEILRTTPCTEVYIGGTEGEPLPGGGRHRVSRQAQARADVIVAAWDRWQAEIAAAKEAANLPALTAAKEAARETRNAVLLRVREATAVGLTGLAIKARIAANMLVETDPKASALSYDADDPEGLFLDLAGDVLALTGGLPAAHGGGAGQ